MKLLSSKTAIRKTSCKFNEVSPIEVMFISHDIFKNPIAFFMFYFIIIS